MLSPLGLEDSPQTGPWEEPHRSEDAPCVSEPGAGELLTARVDEERAPGPSFWRTGGGQASVSWGLSSGGPWNLNTFTDCFSSPFKHQVVKTSGVFHKAEGFCSLGNLS